MAIEQMQAEVALEPGGRGLSLSNAAGLELTSVSGHAWLAMEGDSRYVDLPAGGAHTVESDGLAQVSAAEPSLVRLRFPKARPSAWKRSLRWLEAWFVSTGQARVRARMHQGLYSWD